jgi:cyclic-di-GMP phosphodiesterase TipF (flagellum assembly factor)
MDIGAARARISTGGYATGSGMVRISAIFIAICMLIIAASLGIVLYLRFGLTGAESALVALATLTALGVYNTIAARTRDRTEVDTKIADLSRGSSDLARQVAEYGRRLGSMETKVEVVLERALATAQPLAAEIEELSALVRQLADSVAAHERKLSEHDATPAPGLPAVGDAARQGASAALDPAKAAGPAAGPAVAPAAAPPPPATTVENFKGQDPLAIVALVRSAIDANRVDLYLQPIVTLPQRKVRYYEALSRLKAEDGEVIAAADFLPHAEAGRLMPQLDDLSVLRCVQVVRRLLLKNRDIGLFCNLSSATLTGGGFPQFLEFADANRAIAPSLMFEFTQAAVRAMGPIEHESLAALAERGYRFSMDNVTDLRVEPRELADRSFRFIKVPATLLLNRAGAASTDIHPADLSDLLGRFGIDLIAEKIEAENTVVDLLDYDVRFGQGFLFSPPRPVRAEALQGIAETVDAAPRAVPAGAAPSTPAVDTGPPPRAGALAHLARTGSGRV